MRSFWRPMLIVSLILALPIIPFLMFGEQMEQWAEQWRASPQSGAVTWFVVVGLLAADIFLPTPSSVISTAGGWELGWHWGTLASWTGMSLGAMIGFGLARRCGKPVAAWLAEPDTLRRMQRMSDRYGPLVLVITRAVPILAEASVLLMGLHQLSWRRFLPPILLSNLGVALAYSAFGDFAEQRQWLPLALGVSIALPVVLATMVKLIWKHELGDEVDSSSVSTSEEG